MLLVNFGSAYFLRMSPRFQQIFGESYRIRVQLLKRIRHIALLEAVPEIAPIAFDKHRKAVLRKSHVKPDIRKVGQVPA
jgi:hypothetical protein